MARTSNEWALTSMRLRAATIGLSLIALFAGCSKDQTTIPMPAPAHAFPVTLQPAGNGPDNSGAGVIVNDPSHDPQLSPAQLTQLLQAKIKYVFVIFNENHSFDNEYGTFPGVNGVYSDGTTSRIPASNTQTYTDVNGNSVTVQPFLIGPLQNANAIDSADHAHVAMATKINVQNGIPQLDQFALEEYGRFAVNTSASIAQQKEGTQFANLVMSHIDCDTIPFFWRWASNFTIFDHIYATEDTPSAPNAIAMIAGQSGETQWVKHPSTTSDPTATGTSGPMNGFLIQLLFPKGSVSYSGAIGTTQGPPMVNDPNPWYGSQFDATPSLSPLGVVSGAREPYGINDSYAPNNISSNFTFATVPLMLMGNTIAATLNPVPTPLGNQNPSFDLPDIQNDIPYIQNLNHAPVDWRWYQNGYDHESADADHPASHISFVSHHDAPQFFGYLANTPSQAAKLKGETDFFTDVANNALPNGGIFYIRGGVINQMGLQPYVNPGNPAGPAMLATKLGDDDHPVYSDRQLSEAMAARVINAIAGQPALWAQSAIIITYDESDGYYDHMPPRILSYGPDSLPLSRGLRVPLLLISPFARTHAVAHAEGDHNSVIQTLSAIFNLPALASLPDEAQALVSGNSAYFNQFSAKLGPAGFQQKYLGPRDLNSPITDSLLSGFDPMRLMGQSPPLPASIAMVDPTLMTTLPHYNGKGCSALHFTPVPEPAADVVPAGFNPLPSTYPAAN